MKRILITGKNSYIGTSFENYLSKFPNEYYIETLDMRDENWRSFDFSKFDVVFHVAGIAHVSSNPKLKDLYYKVNRDLTIDVAKKAKQDKVKQFIFMSSIIVYGECKETNGLIDIDTIPNPKDFYGDSKLQAEEGIKNLETSKFKVVILRPPMIYGKGSKGNFKKLSTIAKTIPIFPEFENSRSMIYIENFCEFIRVLIKLEKFGTFFPQNEEYVNTSDLVKTIAMVHGKKIYLTRKFNLLIEWSLRLEKMNKVFGSLVYEKSMSEYDESKYSIVKFKESIERSET